MINYKRRASNQVQVGQVGIGGEKIAVKRAVGVEFQTVVIQRGEIACIFLLGGALDHSRA